MQLEELEKKIQNGDINNIYLFYGEETYLLETTVKKIKKTFKKLIEGINYIVLDEKNVQHIIADIETPAFGYDKKLIIVKNVNLFSKNVKTKKISEELNEYIKENAKSIIENNVIIFVEKEVETTELLKTVQANGIVINFAELKPADIMKRIKHICMLYKVNISDSTLRFFVETCGTNMQELINEIRKLIEYVGENGEIKESDIKLLSTYKIESVIFDLTDNLGKKNVKKALENLDGLIYNKEPIQKILITLYNHFKKLYFSKLGQVNNKDISKILKLKPNQTFLISKYRNQSSYFKIEELRQIIQELSDLDYKYKLGLIDVQLGLESVLYMYCN